MNKTNRKLSIIAVSALVVGGVVAPVITSANGVKATASASTSTLTYAQRLLAETNTLIFQIKDANFAKELIKLVTDRSNKVDIAANAFVTAHNVPVDTDGTVKLSAIKNIAMDQVAFETFGHGLTSLTASEKAKIESTATYSQRLLANTSSLISQIKDANFAKELIKLVIERTNKVDIAANAFVTAHNVPVDTDGTVKLSAIKNIAMDQVAFETFGHGLTSLTASEKAKIESTMITGTPVTTNTHAQSTVKPVVLKEGFKTESGKTYFYVKGVSAKGFKTISGKTYYFDARTGVQVKGFKTISGKTYYFDTRTGVEAKGFKTISGKTYYFDTRTGVQAKGFKTISGKTYYFDTRTGVEVKGFKTISGKTYYFDTRTGVQAKGFKTLNHKTYYFDSKTGVQAKGFRIISGKLYFFNTRTGVKFVGNKNINFK